MNLDDIIFVIRFIKSLKEFSISMKVSDWISIVSIVVNAGLALFVVWRVQKSVANSRTLKDYFIEEVKDLRDEVKTLVIDLQKEDLRPKDMISSFNLISIRINDVLKLCAEKYGIKTDILEAYQLEMRDVVTNSNEYIQVYRSNNIFTLENMEKSRILNIHKRNSKFFDKIIIDINDYS